MDGKNLYFTILILDRVDFKSKRCIGDDGGHFKVAHGKFSRKT